MMSRSWTPLVPVALAAAIAGCGDGPAGPDPVEEPVRLLLVHRLETGENLLLRTDGSPAGELGPLTRGMLPIASHSLEEMAALLDGSAIVLATLDRPDLIDTIIASAPASLSLATFSSDGRFLALVAYAPVPGLLVYDRANRRLDTLPLNGVEPVLPPMFSPDGARVALVSLNDLSILVTIVELNGSGATATRRLAVSRFTNRLLFGWPRWREDGFTLAFRRVAEDGPDTLLVGVVDAEVDGAHLDERFRALLAPVEAPNQEVGLRVESTYALSTDATMLALGAIPGGGAPHGIYVVTAGGGTSTVSRIRPLLDVAGETPVYPLFIRE